MLTTNSIPIVYLAASLFFVSSGIVVFSQQEKAPPTVAETGSQDLTDDNQGFSQAKQLLDPGISPEDFLEIVKNSGGKGKVMETLSLFAASPPLLEGKFDQVLASIALFPNSEAAQYLASNRYLTENQIAELGKIAQAKPDSDLAGNLAKNLSLTADVMVKLVSVGIDNPRTKLAKKIVGSPILTEDLQNTICDKVLANPRGELGPPFAGNPQLLPSIKDKLGAAVIDSPDTQMSESFGQNPGLSLAQIDALAAVAVAFPDSKLAEGVGRNPSLQSSHYETLMRVVKVHPESKLGVAVASNPNATDAVFATLFSLVVANPESSLGPELARAGGGASTPARIANLANQVITSPNVKYARELTGNTMVPLEFFDAMIRTAIGQPRSELCRGFMEDVREKRFKGNHSQKMKIIEVSLTYGE